MREYDDELLWNKYYIDSEPDLLTLNYVDEENYAFLKDNVKIVGSKFIKESKAYLPNASRNLCDYFCRLMIYSFAQEAKKLTPANLYKTKSNEATESEYSARGLITSGRYTNWKAPFMESGFAENLGVSVKKYKMPGVGELLEYPAICILLLYEYFFKGNSNEDALSEISKRGKENNLWKLIKKILESYHAGEKKIELRAIEKNDLFCSIFRHPLNIYEDSYLYTRKRLKTEENVIKEEWIYDLRKVGEELCSKYEQVEEKKLIFEEGSNCDDRRFQFAKYLAPIIAAICEYFSEEDIYKEMKLWKREKTYRQLKKCWIHKDCTEEMCDELSKSYSTLLEYLKSERVLDNLYENGNFLENYYYMVGLMLYKIGCREKKVLKEEYKFIQYYVTEYLMKMELIEIETEAIYKYIKKDLEKKRKKALKKTFKKALKKAFKNALENAPEKAFENVLENASEKAFEKALKNALKNTLENALENVSEKASEKTFKEVFENTLKNALKNASERESENALENVLKNALENVLEKTSEKDPDNDLENASERASEKTLKKNSEKDPKIIVNKFLKKNKFLKNALNRLAGFEGAFTRIGLAEQTIQKYFERVAENKVNRKRARVRTLKTIRYETYFYHMHQQLFLESAFMDDIDSKGMCNVFREKLLNRTILFCGGDTKISYLGQTNIFLNNSIELSKTFENKRSIKKYAKEKVLGLDDLKREILIWVISQNFSQSYLADIKFDVYKTEENQGKTEF